MKHSRAVITGTGIVSPAGNDQDEFFGNIAAGKSFISEITRFDASRYPARHAGIVERLDEGHLFSKRLIKKLDRFSHMALVAADSAIADSGLDLEAEDKERLGIILGNALGGWGFAEEELRDLYTSGIKEVSPYQATAWFPAAPQGQLSIHYGIKGFSKTIISDLASSHLALGYAARAVSTGKADVMLAGGAEAPISPYALLCCNTSGELSLSGRYWPFDKGRDGYVIAEGAAVLVVEGFSRAKARGARILAEIKGFGHTSDGVDPVLPDRSGKGLMRAMLIALSQAGLSPGDIDYLLPAGAGGALSDESEAAAVAGVFGKSNGFSVGIPKACYGNLLGASGALDAAVACMAMERGVAPRANVCNPEEGWEWLTKKNGSKSGINNVMINSTGRGGVNACLVLGKIKE